MNIGRNDGDTVVLLVPVLDLGYIQEVVGRLCGQFGGVTISDASGVWTDDSGVRVVDNHVRLEVFIGHWRDHEEWFIGLCKEVSDRLNQECIMLSVVSGAAWLIGREEV